MHDRESITQIRCGFPANVSGPTFWLLSGKAQNPVYTDAFLEQHGAAKHSTIIMTENGFLTDEAWQQLVPFLIKGLRHAVRMYGRKLGIDPATCDKLTLALTFDGFKSHIKNLSELLLFATNNILAAVENRDSSEINQVNNQYHTRTNTHVHN